MDKSFHANLKKYADLVIKVGLNLQPGQKLVMQALKDGGVPIQTAPLVRELAASAYQAGAKLANWDMEMLRVPPLSQL